MEHESVSAWAKHFSMLHLFTDDMRQFNVSSPDYLPKSVLTEILLSVMDSEENQLKCSAFTFNGFTKIISTELSK